MAKIDVEITSQREDGDWTWRAVGAREPKGTVEASLLPDDLSVGTQFSVETEHFLDGIVVTKVFDKKQDSEKLLCAPNISNGENGGQSQNSCNAPSGFS